MPTRAQFWTSECERGSCIRVESGKMFGHFAHQAPLSPKAVEEGSPARQDVLACCSGLPDSILCQGISCGGAQEGLGDSRTGLLVEVFRIFDTLPHSQRLVSFKLRVLLLVGGVHPRTRYKKGERPHSLPDVGR